MFKKWIFISAVVLVQTSFAADAVVSSDEDKMHLAGTYQCSGHDSHDGYYENVTVTLSVDTKNSDFDHNHGAYRFKLMEPDGIEYDGEAASDGNTLAIYFQNTSANEPTDRGVGIASVVHERDANGNVTTKFYKFYYEPDYQGGGNGSEVCTRQENRR